MRLRAAITVVAIALIAPATSAQISYPATPVSRFNWAIDDPDFGGWSGLEVSADGSRFVMISDRGAILSGRISRDRGGEITSVGAGRIHTLHHTDGGPLPRYSTDSEGLAIGPDGTVYVSFETDDRVVRYGDTNTAQATALPIPGPWKMLPINESLEALAVGPDSALYVIPEFSAGANQPFPVYRYADGDWSEFSAMPRYDKFLPVGADIGPDGRLYVLERKFIGIFGFASRVRRFEIAPGELIGEETVFRSESGAYDNLEGLAVWRDGGGKIRLTMVSDDNFKFFQSTQFVEYVVDE